MAREEEVGLLRACFEDPEVPGIVVTGGPGVGKSRLVHEAMETPDEVRSRALWAVATAAAASIPFGSVAHLMPAVGQMGETDRFSLFNAFAANLAEGAEGGRLALVVDDAHLLDPAGAALVFHVANVRAAFVCAVVRDGEPIPDAVRGLWKDAGATRLDLEPLAPDAAAELIELTLDGHVEGASKEALATAAGGNVLFLREIVVASLETGSLSLTNDVWHWTGEVPGSAPLIELVEARIGRLDAAERRVLEILALGEPLGARVLERLAGVDEVAALERRDLLALGHDGRREVARLAHPLHSEVIGPRVPHAEARAIRLALAEEVERLGMRRREDLLRMANWRLEADGTGDPALLTDAAVQATRSFDPELGVRLARAAADAGAGFRAALILAEALIMQNHFEEAEAALAPHEREALAGDSARHYVFQRTLALHWGLGRSEEADAMLRAARPAHDDRTWRQQVDGLRAQVLAFDGSLDEAVRLAGAVEDPESDRWARLYGVSAVITGLTFSGRTDQALEVLTPYVELALELAEGFPHGPAWIAGLQGTTLFHAGRLDEVEALASGFLDLATSVGDEQARGGALMGFGIIAMQRGDLVTARRWLREAVTPLRRSDLAGFLPWTFTALARVEGEAGDAAASRGALRSAAKAGATRPRNRLYVHFDVMAEAWAAAASGELSQARAIALEGARELAELAVHEASLLVTALRLGAPVPEVAPRLEEVCRDAESGMLRAWGSYATALATGSGEAIEAAGSELEQLGHLLHAAEIYVAASSAFADEGRADSARRAAARATALSEGSCVGARTPGLAELDAPELTRREREIAELAARGLANSEIAEQLTVSVRTVEWHLQQVYGKVGIAGREELSSVL